MLIVDAPLSEMVGAFGSRGSGLSGGCTGDGTSGLGVGCFGAAVSVYDVSVDCVTTCVTVISCAMLPRLLGLLTQSVDGI